MAVSDLRRAGIGGRSDFLLGANLPWMTYGCDFGANAWHEGGGLSRSGQAGRARDVLRGLHDSGARAVRWFLLCDGRSGLRVAPDGSTAGFDDYLFRDLDTALALLDQTRLAAIFVLFDFLWFSQAQLVNGVQLGGRTRVLADTAARDRFLDTVIGPLLERYGQHDAIAAWDVINEPEWATTRRPFLRRGAVSRSTMREVIGAVARLVHERTRHPATAGCASAAALPMVSGLGLDFYQVHWYDGLPCPFDVSTDVCAHGVDRPILLGEFPTRGSSRPAAAILDAARSAGYAGAFGWSAMAADKASDRDALKVALGGASAVNQRP